MTTLVIWCETIVTAIGLFCIYMAVREVYLYVKYRKSANVRGTDITFKAFISMYELCPEEFGLHDDYISVDQVIPHEYLSPDIYEIARYTFKFWDLLRYKWWHAGLKAERKRKADEEAKKAKLEKDIRNIHTLQALVHRHSEPDIKKPEDESEIDQILDEVWKDDFK